MNDKRLTLKDRQRLEEQYKAGTPIEKIAKMLSVHKSTIYRELDRGKMPDEEVNGRPGYSAEKADLTVSIARHAPQPRRQRIRGIVLRSGEIISRPSNESIIVEKRSNKYVKSPECGVDGNTYCTSRTYVYLDGFMRCSLCSKVVVDTSGAEIIPKHRPNDILYRKEAWATTSGGTAKYLYMADIHKDDVGKIKWSSENNMPADAARVVYRVDNVGGAVKSDGSTHRWLWIYYLTEDPESFKLFCEKFL